MFCILYDLDVWPRNPSNNFKFKDYLFGASVIVKNSDKQKYGIIWIVQVHGILIMIMLEMLSFLALIILDHLMLTI